MGILDALMSRLFHKAEPISEPARFAAFMDSRAAFLAQKCVVEFCRVRAGVYWQKLFSEAEFQAAWRSRAGRRIPRHSRWWPRWWKAHCGGPQPG